MSEESKKKNEDASGRIMIRHAPISVHVWCGNDCCCYWKTGENGGAMDTEDSAAVQGTDKTRVV